MIERETIGVRLGADLVNAALSGLGLAHVMESSVRQELADKRLARVLDSFCLPFPGFFLYYPSRTHLAPKLKAFVELFKFPQRRVR